MNNLQKLGGWGAWIHALAYIVSMVLGGVLMFPLLGRGPGAYVAFVAGNQVLVYLWNLAAYWGSALTLVAMVLALYERLKLSAPGAAQLATAFGLIWAALIIGSGNLMLRDVGVIAELHAQDPSQAAGAWVTLEAVENGIVSGNEVVGSLWVLLLSLTAWRTRELPKWLNLLGLIISLTGLLTILPPLAEPLIMIFGVGMIVWSVGLGVALLRAPGPIARRAVALGGAA
ncbi:MAG: DUF4386 family protein [Anaerolineales bacterium]|nr:DUF4386 family protein [Anaerolineales bacterium]